jgi:hypothetical protein
MAERPIFPFSWGRNRAFGWKPPMPQMVPVFFCMSLAGTTSGSNRKLAINRASNAAFNPSVKLLSRPRKEDSFYRKIALDTVR